jgi:hypothetical protein
MACAHWRAWDGGGYGGFILVRHYNGWKRLWPHEQGRWHRGHLCEKAGQLIGYRGTARAQPASSFPYTLRCAPPGQPTSALRWCTTSRAEAAEGCFTITARL